MRRAFAFLIVFALFAAAAFGLYWFQFRVKPEMVKGFIAAAGQPTQTVAVAEAKTQTWTPQFSAIGTVRAVQGVDIAPQVGGVIRAIRFDSAQDVQKGAPLVELDDSTEQADLKSAQAQLRNAQQTYERQAQLNYTGAGARANLDTAVSARDQAQAAVERIKAVIAQKTIVAPFAGRLGIRRIDLGQYVGPGAALVSLQQLDPIFVDFQAPEQQIANLRVGQTVHAGVDALKRTFDGKIKYLDARIANDTRNFLVRAEIPNPDRKLLPGMFANVDVAAGAPREAVVVPRTAVTYSLYGDSIFVAKMVDDKSGAATLERHAVKVGETQGSLVVIEDGVAAGDFVVSEGQNKLQPGMKVKVDPNAGLPPLKPLPKE
ncbi:MAG: efflux RND transporter periplasmic adaptor subunit [Hyphomicrobiales bacterium]|nr:efflux RND transporter periplasmic adaptor subunit [Hyphomicrobiales bacterium]